MSILRGQVAARLLIAVEWNEISLRSVENCDAGFGEFCFLLFASGKFVVAPGLQSHCRFFFTFLDVIGDGIQIYHR
jgi:hypothetical protein